MPLIWGCAASPVEAPPPPPAYQIEVISGNDQAGDAGDSLSFPIQIRITDKSGAPVLGQRVAWRGQNGVPIEDTTRTDALGMTSVRFVLGMLPGNARLVASLAARPDSATFDFTVRPDPSENQSIALDLFRPLDLKTYEGSNETVHPDYVATPFGRFLVVTPYPGGNRNFENPSVYTGFGSWRWRAPAGLTNPVAKPSSSSYLSDPDMVYDGTSGQLFLYYRQVDNSNDIDLVRSSNGVTWSTPVRVVAAPRDQVVSPAVVRRSASEWLMWAVDAGPSGCSARTTQLVLRRSTDGVTWGTPEDVSLGQGAPMPWHIDVQWIPSKQEYWAMYSAKPDGSCGTPAMMFARSSDGVAWSVNEIPLVSRGMDPEIADVVYRATFRYDAATDDLRLWVSGAAGSDGAYVWHTVYGRMKAAPLLDGQPHLVNPWTFTASMPLLTDGP